MNQYKNTSKLSIISGLILALIFSILAFRNVSAQEVWSSIRTISPWKTLLAICLVLGILFTRGLRWWLLLPEPRSRLDFLSAQRASALGYGVTNLATRLGEIVRIGVFARDSGRNPAQVTATVVVDRLLFDFFAFACFFAYALLAYREQMKSLFPRLETGFQAFLVVTLIGILGLVGLSRFPALFLLLLKKLGLPRFKRLWVPVEALFHQLIDGLVVCRNPWRLALVQLVNLFAWGLGVLYFQVALSASGIQPALGDLLLIFTISTFGIIVPSPGGIGTFHYFVALGLTSILGYDQAQATAAATYTHGLNYLVVSIIALGFLFWGKPRTPKPLMKNLPEDK